MSDLDIRAPNYSRAQQRWPEAATLAKCYEELNACFDRGGQGLVEHAKSFIESVCLTIMAELREPMPSSNPSTTELLVAALSPLGLRNTRGASKLDKVLSGFNKLADALSDMRNENGPVAHGKDAFVDALTADHARAFLYAGDAILSVLLNAFEGKQPDLTSTREPYGNFPHLNERIDRMVSVEARIDEDGEHPIVVFSVATGIRGEAIELRVEPSRLLYGIDRSAYIEVLRTADVVIAVAEDVPMEPEGQIDSDKASSAWSASAALLLTDVIRTYEGPLHALRPGLVDFLVAEGVDPTGQAEGGARLLDSLLATAEQHLGLDWTQRESLQARLKVAFKRVLVQFGVPPLNAPRVADRLMTWLRVQARDVGAAGQPAPVRTEGTPL